MTTLQLLQLQMHTMKVVMLIGRPGRADRPAASLADFGLARLTAGRAGQPMENLKILR